AGCAPTIGVTKPSTRTKSAQAPTGSPMAAENIGSSAACTTRAWAAEMHRVAAPQGRLCLNVPFDTTRGGQRPVYADSVSTLPAAGWGYRATIIWNEGNVSRSVARGRVDSPSAPRVMAPVETIMVCHRGGWNLNRVAPHNLRHDDWLVWTNRLW